MNFEKTIVPAKIRKSFFSQCRELIYKELGCKYRGHNCYYEYSRDIESGTFFCKFTFKKKVSFVSGEKPKFVGIIFTGNFRNFEESLKIHKSVVRSQKWRMKETTEKFFCKAVGKQYFKQKGPRRYVSETKKEELKERMAFYHREREEHLAQCPACQTAFDCNDRREGRIMCVNCKKEFELNIDTLVRFSKI